MTAPRHRSTGRLLPLAAMAIGLGVALAACSSSSGTTTGGPTSTAATPTTASGPAGSSTAGGSTPKATAAAKVSATSGSADEIQKALEAAGVTNAARWTREVMEYRPYPADDPSLGKLKKELQKYNPSAETLEKILSALSP